MLEYFRNTWTEVRLNPDVRTVVRFVRKFASSILVDGGLLAGAGAGLAWFAGDNRPLAAFLAVLCVLGVGLGAIIHPRRRSGDQG